jgi:hypothetical protein
MRGVRALGLVKSTMEARGWQRRAALSQSGARLSAMAALQIILCGAWREVLGFEFRGSRQVRNLSGARPNKPMHPTADTKPVVYFQTPGAAGDWRRYAD